MKSSSDVLIPAKNSLKIKDVTKMKEALVLMFLALLFIFLLVLPIIIVPGFVFHEFRIFYSVMFFLYYVFGICSYYFLFKEINSKFSSKILINFKKSENGIENVVTISENNEVYLKIQCEKIKTTFIQSNLIVFFEDEKCEKCECCGYRWHPIFRYSQFLGTIEVVVSDETKVVETLVSNSKLSLVPELQEKIFVFN